MACPASATIPKTTLLTPHLYLNPLNTLQPRKNLHLPLFRTPPLSSRIYLTTLNSSSSTIPPSALSWSSKTDEEYDEDEDEDEDEINSAAKTGKSPPLRVLRKRYRKLHPGEKVGITEEMRFVAMKLRNSGKPRNPKVKNNIDDIEEMNKNDEEIGEENGKSWEPSMEGFLKYLVDSKHVFTTIERIVDESSDVSFVYFRKTVLERAECLSRDLEWFSQQGNSIPEPSNPGITYANYLEEIAGKTPALFISHFYNIYFSHIAGGQVIAKKVSKKILDERELEFFKWEGNEEELLRGVREKLNMLGEHWTRDEKNKCLREATKAFRFLGQIVRLIIL